MRSLNKGDYVIDLTEYIKEDVKELYQIHKKFQNPNYISWGGRNVNINIFTSIHYLIKYSLNNKLYIENDKNYPSIITEALKGLLLSSIIDDRCENKLKYWDLDYTILFIHWVNSNEIYDFINDNEIKKLSINDIERELLIETFIEPFQQFLSNFITSNNEFVDNLNTFDSLLKVKMKRIINNFLIFGYLFDLNKYEFSEIKKPLFDNLEKLVYNYHLTESKILIIFFEKYLQYFEDNDCKKLINIFVQIHIKSKKRELVIEYFGIFKNKSNILLEKEEIEFIILNFKNDRIDLVTFFNIYLLFFSDKDKNDNKYLIENKIDSIIQAIGILPIAERIQFLSIELSDIYNQKIIDLILKVSDKMKMPNPEPFNLLHYISENSYKGNLEEFSTAFLYLRSINEDFKLDKYEKLREFKYAKWLIYPNDFNYEEDFDLLWLEYNLTFRMIEELKLYPKVKTQYEKYLSIHQNALAFKRVLNHYLKHFV